jgi:hypothetical protein
MEHQEFMVVDMVERYMSNPMCMADIQHQLQGHLVLQPMRRVIPIIPVLVAVDY